MHLSRRGFLGRIAAAVAVAPLVAISATPDAVEAAPNTGCGIVPPNAKFVEKAFDCGDDIALVEEYAHLDNLAQLKQLAQLHEEGLITFKEWRRRVGMEDQWPDLSYVTHKELWQ